MKYKTPENHEDTSFPTDSLQTILEMMNKRSKAKRETRTKQTGVSMDLGKFRYDSLK